MRHLPDELLLAFLEQAVEGEELQTARLHLEECSLCRSRLDAIQGQLDAWCRIPLDTESEADLEGLVGRVLGWIGSPVGAFQTGELLPAGAMLEGRPEGAMPDDEPDAGAGAELTDVSAVIEETPEGVTIRLSAPPGLVGATVELLIGSVSRRVVLHSGDVGAVGECTVSPDQREDGPIVIEKVRSPSDG